LLNGGLPHPRKRKSEGIISVAGKTPPSREQLSMAARKCDSCGIELRYQGRGRPRRYCENCVPRGGGAAGSRAWRSVNAEHVLEYGRARRRAQVM